MLLLRKTTGYLGVRFTEGADKNLEADGLPKESIRSLDH